MSDDAIGPGTILHWEGFKFTNGVEANKYFVIVGAQPGRNYLVIIATSQQKGRNADPGGNPQGAYFAIRGGGKDWFPKETWLLFEEPVELSAMEFENAVRENTITVSGQLRGDLTNRICNCMKKSAMTLANIIVAYSVPQFSQRQKPNS
jgi:hypothetical protein